MSNGRFIVLEGLDGAGTTTQGERLVAALEALGRPALFTFEPSDLPVGLITRAVIQGAPDAPNPTLLPWLFAADRADHLDRVIQPAMAAGAVVISDRFVGSSLAYQTLSAPFEQIVRLNADFQAADLTIYLEVPVTVCLERIEARRLSRGGVPPDLFEKRSALERVEVGYDKAMKFLKKRGDNVVRLDGTRAVEDLAREILALVQAL